MNATAPKSPNALSNHVLMQPCACGHQRWKHVAFSFDCREAGCGCQFFGEATGDRGPTTGSSVHGQPSPVNPPKGNLP
jgi:hypothetical protein